MSRRRRTPAPRRSLRRPARTSAPAAAGRGSARDDGSVLRLRLREPGDLFAAVPHVLGFHPQDSLVVVALVPVPGAGGDRRMLGPVLRADLPPDPSVVEDATAVVEASVLRFAPHAPPQVALLVVGGGAREPDGAPPASAMVEQAVAGFTALGTEVTMRAWVPRIAASEAWCCYPPCACAGGTLPVVDSSPVAAASALLGRVTYGSRAELEATLAAGPEVGSPHRRELLRRAHDAAATDRELAGSGAVGRDLAAVRRARAEVAAGRVLGDAELARVGAALTDVVVRDACLAWVLGDSGDSGDSGGSGDSGDDVEHFWTVLVRSLPAPEVAEPAALLALTLLARGGGTLAAVALDRARRADPDHRLTHLVTALLDRGASAEDFADVVRESGREAVERFGRR